MEFNSLSTKVCHFNGEGKQQVEIAKKLRRAGRDEG